MTSQAELNELTAFNAGDEARRQGVADPATMSDGDFQHLIDGTEPDFESQALAAKDAKDAADLLDFMALAKQQSIARGWDDEAKVWRTPKPPATDLAEPMPRFATDPQGVPLVSPERWAAYRDFESGMGSLSDAQFEAVLAARSGKFDTVYGNYPDDNRVNEVYEAGISGEAAPE
jgi:hypothetical protein